ncbi:MAG: hypothetical protein R6X12_10385 [bacterium]
MMKSSTVVALAAIVLFTAGTPAAAQEVADPHEGRGSFLLQQIPLGLWYGSGLSSFLTNDNTSSKVQAAVGLLGSSACYFGPLALVWNRPMSNAQAHLAVAFGYRGIFAGFALGDLFNLGNERVWDQESQMYYDRFNVRPRMGLMVLTSMASQVGGYFLARDMSLGQATLVTTYSDFGWTNGLLGALTEFDLSDGRRELKLSGWYLGGLAAGATAGWFRQKNWDCTEGQVTFVRTAGALGHVVPLCAVYALTGIPFEDDEDRDRMAWLGPLMLAGNIGAVYGAERLIHNAPLGTGDGYITLGCTVAGGLLGAGLGWLFTDENARWAARPVLGGGALGAVGGLALGLRLTPGWSAAFSAAPPGRDGRARVHVNTGALAGAVVDYAARREFSAPSLITVEF